MEKNSMTQVPRPFTTNFFKLKELTTSIVQGLMITAGTLLIYRYAVSCGYTEAITRTMVFSVLLSSNIFLTLVNRSFYFSVLTTLRYRNDLLTIIIAITIATSGLLIYVKPVAIFFRFQQLSFAQLTLCILAGFASVIWFEGSKWLARRKNLPISNSN